MTTKSLGQVEVKNADKGEVEAVFSTFNVVDHDGDLTLPGAFTEGAAVRISAYQHKSWQGSLPVGKGTIRTTDTEAILMGQFFMGIPAARDTFEVVKELGPLQEWSYSLEDVISDVGERDGRHVNILKSIKVTEVSPVLVGAGIDTRTLAVKSAATFSDEASAVLSDVSGLLDSATRVVALRAEKGKTLSKVNAEILAGIADALKQLEALLAAEPEPQTGELEREFLRYSQIAARL